MDLRSIVFYFLEEKVPSMHFFSVKDIHFVL